MTVPPNGDPPREDEPNGGDEELPELEAEFQDALREASGKTPEPQPDEPPKEERAESDETVEFEAPEAPPAEEGSAGAPDQEGDDEEEDEEVPGQEDVDATEGQVEQDGSPDTAEQPQVEAKPVRTVVIPPGEVAEPAIAAPSAASLPQAPPLEGDPEPAPRRPRLWLRFLLASFVIIGSCAAAVSSSILLEVNSIANDLRPIPGIEDRLNEVNPGDPQNILVLGSDKRASLKGTKGLSDTTILLRLDPDNDAIAIMSIPRDLKTYIPGVGTTKFNAAYAYGGPKLTLKVVKRITGLHFQHVVNVDFLGFVRAINAIDCVYVDVDRHYYHSNLGLPPSQQYAEINVRPGYQKLCGKHALEYVRYRHTDTDLVRAARQQDFLREARQRVPLSKLVFPSQRNELIDIFTTYTSSDLHGLRAMLDVLDLFIASRNAPIKEIHFPAILHPSYVTADKSEIQRVVNKFRGIEASGGPRGALDLPANSGQTGIAAEERKRAKASRQKKKRREKAPPTPSVNNDGLVDAAQGSSDVAASAARRVGRAFPVFYPRRLPSGSIYIDNPRVYHLRDTNKNKHGAYKMVLQLPLGDYFGVQGVRGWTNPPILNDPSESRTMAGRDFDIYLDGDRVRLISWQQNGNSYWVSNSLLQTLTNVQMLGIARSIGKLPGERGRHQNEKKGR